MGKPLLHQHFQFVPLADRNARRSPFPYPIHRQHGRFLERGGIKSAGRMRHVVLREINPPHGNPVPGKSAFQGSSHPSLVLDPGWHRCLKNRKAAGSTFRQGGQEAGELGDGFVVKSHGIELLAGFHPCRLETIGDGSKGKPLVMLFPRKPLLLGGSDDFPVLDKGGGAVVIKCADPENVHGLESFRFSRTADTLSRSWR